MDGTTQKGALATEGALAVDVGLRAKYIEPVRIFYFGLLVEDEVLELGSSLLERDGFKFSSVDELKQVAAEGHLDHSGEFAGFHCIHGIGHPFREILAVDPAEIATAVCVHI